MSRVRPNLIDRAVSFVSPGLGLQRMRSRAALAVVSGYLGARRDRNATREWSALAASADADTLPDLEVLRARSRDLARNDPLAQSAISTKVVNVIGTGHVASPEIDARRLGLSPEQKEAWEAEARAIWQEWSCSRDCDIARVQTFSELEDLVYRSRLLSGDALVIRRFRRRPGRMLGTCVQVVEADRLSNPDWRSDDDRLAGGIELDADGAPVAYHVANRHLIDRMRRGNVTWQRVPAFSASGRRIVLHIHGPRWRPELTRYAPMLAPVIESLKQRSRYSDAELMAAVVSACFVIGLRSPDGGLGGGLETAKAQEGASGEIKITEPGQIFDLLPDERVESFAPGRPSAQFGPFIDQVAKEIGAGTDLPHELLVKQFNASYSASRAAMEMAWQFFRVDRAHHVSQFCAPVYEDVISEAVALGLLDAPGFFADALIRRAWLGVIWMGPARPTIDPTKDATADEKYLALGVTTRTRITAERFGMPWEQVNERLGIEAEQRRAAGVGAVAMAPAAPAGPAGAEEEEDA